MGWVAHGRGAGAKEKPRRSGIGAAWPTERSGVAVRHPAHFKGVAGPCFKKRALLLFLLWLFRIAANAASLGFLPPSAAGWAGYRDGEFLHKAWRVERF